MTRPRRGAATMLAALLALAACGGPGPVSTVPAFTAPPSSTASGPGPGPRTPVPTATGTPVATAKPTPIPTGGASAPAVELDRSLLEILPADVAGSPIKEEPDSFADAVSDPAFATNVEAAAFFVVVDGGDLASGGVVRLRPGVFNDAFFRDWRDSYDEGACGQAGGVAGRAEAQLGGRTVYITSCAGGLRAYHAWVEPRGAAISLFSLGDRRFGEQLMAALRP